MDAAVFFDGRSSRRHVVALTFADRLEIAPADAPDTPLASWAYDTLRRADGPDDALRLSCTAAPPLARLELHDRGAQADIRAHCRMLDGPGSAHTVPAWRITFASLGAAAAIFGLIWFGLPLIADRLAGLMPYTWERPLGAAIDPRIRRFFGHACEAPGGVAAVHKLTARLRAAVNVPLAGDPVVLQSAIPNAFALPGGRVYILKGLLTKTESPDELAGVLAHEFGHVAHRDHLRRLIRTGGTAFLVGLMFGDITGSGAVLAAGQAVLNASFSRDDEHAADAYAATVMQRIGRPIAPLGALLQRIGGPGESAIPSLLRDHPLSPERKTTLDAADTPASGPVLLDAGEWQSLKLICDTKAKGEKQ